MAGTTSGKLTRSLYVGTTTSRRSATSLTASQKGTSERQNQYAHPGGRSYDGGHSHDLGPVSQRHSVLAAPSERHGHKRVVCPEHGNGGAIDLRLPGGMIRTTHRQERGAAGTNPDG